MRTFARLFNLTLCAVAGALLTHSAAAKEPTAAEKKAASEGFKSCHEQERYGDATACWRVWYDKYASIGGEAEVLYAQEKLKHAGVPIPAPKTDDKPASKPEPTPPLPTPKPEPKSDKKKDKEPPPEPKTVEVKPSEEPKQDEAPAAAGADAAAAAAPVVAAGVTVSGPNLCEIKPDASAKGFTRKRVVVFSFADAESLETDPAIKTAGGAEQLREVFIERFPLDRFANVITTFSGATGWEGAPQLTKADIKQRIQSAKTDATGAALDRLAQMVDCADYVVFPTVMGHTVKPLAAQTKNGKQMPAGVELTLSAKLGIFKTADDSFTRLATLEANVPTFFDRGIETAAAASAGAMAGATGAMDSANKAANQVKNAQGQLENAANQVKNAGDQLSNAAGNLANGQAPGGLGLSNSSGSSDQKSGDGEPLIKNPMGSMHERLSDRCTKPKGTDDMVNCEVRVRGYQAAMHFREDAASVEGWQLSGPLKYIGGAADAPGIGLGKEEAVHIGDRFVVVGPDGNRQAYYRVTEVGPGGSAGDGSPSKLALRLGDAPEGSELREYRKFGIEIELHGGVSLLPFNSPGQYYVYGSDATGELLVPDPYVDPKIVLGGGGSIGYDLSSLLGVNELHVRVGGEYLKGSGKYTDATVMPLELSIEKGFYLGKGLGFFLGVGPSYTLVTMGVVDPSGTRYDLKGKRFGAQGQLGLDILFSPSLTMRVSGVVHYNFGGKFSDLEYNGVPVGDAIQWRDTNLNPVDPAEPYSTAGGRLGFIYTL